MTAATRPAKIPSNKNNGKLKSRALSKRCPNSPKTPTEIISGRVSDQSFKKSKGGLFGFGFSDFIREFIVPHARI